ncbi:hypothetical protein BDP27DRAFT_1311250 [Rhodocollybia butyracea]|uniref:Uncharacterized protein n=1 Tax=Rhodocollybia butyracea TaxID=206335 RepID=A0A9P5QA76_9AGAR|nr:hypothetical protein BDP27DRAFT_1311250 [Rhodocollybia butyracea]
MVISLVCSRWRSNSLSMTAIWSRILLQWLIDDGAAGNCLSEHAELFIPLSNFLHRSQQHPLTVNIQINGYPLLKAWRWSTPVVSVAFWAESPLAGFLLRFS